jgi:hypothetical protein
VLYFCIFLVHRSVLSVLNFKSITLKFRAIVISRYYQHALYLHNVSHPYSIKLKATYRFRLPAMSLCHLLQRKNARLKETENKRRKERKEICRLKSLGLKSIMFKSTKLSTGTKFYDNSL